MLTVVSKKINNPSAIFIFRFHIDFKVALSWLAYSSATLLPLPRTDESPIWRERCFDWISAVSLLSDQTTVYGSKMFVFFV